jgi:hypothetical protein
MARSVDDSRPTGRPTGGPAPARAVRRLGRRLVRLVGLQHNPLRRPSDRLEAWARLVLLVLAVLALPAAVGLGVRVAGALHEGAARSGTEHRAVTATLLSEPHLMAVPGHAGPLAIARVSWAMPGHRERVGTAVVAPSARTGDPTTVWVDPDDQLTSAPMSASDAVVLTGLSAVGAYLAGVGALVLLLIGLRRLLDQHRYRAWALDWARFEGAQRR